MSLNQPSPPQEPSLLQIAKQTVAAATTKVTAAAKEVIEEKAHDVLPRRIANLALGERRVHQDGGPNPTYPRYKPPHPESLGIVEPDIRSATPSDPGNGDDSVTSSWEAIPQDMAREGKKLQRADRRRLKATGHDNKNDNNNNNVTDLGVKFKSTCPPQVAQAMTEREEWKESLRKVREQREKRKWFAPARRARPVEECDSSSGESYESKSSDEFVRDFEKLPYNRSWRHGIGKKMVTVPCGSPKVQRIGHVTSKGEAGDLDAFLEELSASQYNPVGTVEDSSVGNSLSRYREMGKYFKAGSVGDASREGNVPGDKDRTE
ncbi:hypothetical protein VMCG_06791 [Cytospora schulzeri]|uniref:Uncharacterized protein n=1 Tax=Cytospora schulzeri TaxID=448051 RepID=A0A423W649_9PEZI|nr:hypothetical protein VMCG_06791 [Valsa malicola]